MLQQKDSFFENKIEADNFSYLCSEGFGKCKEINGAEYFVHIGDVICVESSNLNIQTANLMVKNDTNDIIAMSCQFIKNSDGKCICNIPISRKLKNIKSVNKKKIIYFSISNADEEVFKSPYFWMKAQYRSTYENKKRKQDSETIECETFTKKQKNELNDDIVCNEYTDSLEFLSIMFELSVEQCDWIYHIINSYEKTINNLNNKINNLESELTK